jgi:hypothetical protein
MVVIFRCLGVPWSGRLVNVAAELPVWFRLAYTSNESHVTSAYQAVQGPQSVSYQPYMVIWPQTEMGQVETPGFPDSCH